MSQAFEDFKTYDKNIKKYTTNVAFGGNVYMCKFVTIPDDTTSPFTCYVATGSIIDWGDGTIEKGTGKVMQHIYSETNTIRVITIKSLSKINITFNNTVPHLYRLLEADLSGCRDESLAPAFFSGNNFLTKVVLPPNLRNISKKCFLGTNKLTEIFLPPSVKLIDDEAFKDSGVRVIQKDSFLDQNYLVLHKDAFNHSSIETFSLGSSTKPLIIDGATVFLSCKSLTKLPPVVLTKNAYSVFNHTNLKSLEIAKSVSSTYKNGPLDLSNAKSIEYLVLPDEAITINYLSTMTALRTIICQAYTPYALTQSNIITRNKANGSPYFSHFIVPQGRADAYKTATNWQPNASDIVTSDQTVGMTQATETKLGGVKAVAKTTEMTEPVGIDTDGKLYSKSGGGGGQGSSIYDCAEPITKETLKVLATTVYLPPNFTLKVGDMLFGENGGRALIKSISADGTELTLQFLGELPPNVEIIHFDEPVSATSGTITQEEYDLLSYNTQNLIEFNRELYRLNDDRHEEGFKVYTHVGHDATNKFFIKCITITISTKGWVLSSTEVGGGGGAIPQATETKLGGVKAKTYSGYEKSYEVFIGSSGFLSAFGLPIKLFDIKYESGSSSHGSGRIGVVFFGYNKVDSVFPIKSGVFNFSNYTWESGGDGGTTIGKVLMFHTKETVTFPDPYGHEVRLYNLTDHTYEVLPSGAYQRELPANKSYILLSNMDYGET